MGIREEVENMKKEVQAVKEQSFALEMISDYKKQNKRLFIMWIITMFAFVGLLSYTIYLLNDIGTETITEETETYDMEADNGINNVISGDNNGTNEIHQN